ncbi:MAG: hypothetical protein HZA94_01495 [Candidatus Vogelbacteria bacterium]|nr:hypothetical protein [Candidatus Vogelbacteria bacterium]
MSEKEKWEKILEKEGLGEELGEEFHGEKVELGDGLGRKTEEEECAEDSGEGHSRMCPLNLGRSMDGKVNQVNDRPVEEKIED